MTGTVKEAHHFKHPLVITVITELLKVWILSIVTKLAYNTLYCSILFCMNLNVFQIFIKIQNFE